MTTQANPTAAQTAAACREIETALAGLGIACQTAHGNGWIIVVPARLPLGLDACLALAAPAEKIGLGDSTHICSHMPNLN